MRRVHLLAILAAIAACEKRSDPALGLGMHDTPLERGRLVAPGAPLAPPTRVTVCTRLLLMPRARCDGWAEAREGRITGAQLHELVRMQSRMKRIKRVRVLRLWPGADPNIDGTPVAVPEDGQANFAGFTAKDDRGQLLLFLDATVH